MIPQEEIKKRLHEELTASGKSPVSYTHLPPPAIFGERDHEGEPREEIPRKQQRGIERPHRQSDCGNRAGHGGKRYFIG